MKIPIVAGFSSTSYLVQPADALSATVGTDDTALSKTDLAVLDGATLASSRYIVEILTAVQGSQVPDVVQPVSTVADPVVPLVGALSLRQTERESQINDRITAASAAAAAPAAPSFHLFPYNRRLETNGVDDGLILLSASFDLQQPALRPVDTMTPLVEPVEPVPPALALLPLMPEIEAAASGQPEYRSGIEEPAADKLSPDEPVVENVLLEKVPAKATKATTQTQFHHHRASSRYQKTILMSDPRHSRVVERVAFWVQADMARFDMRCANNQSHQTISAIGKKLHACFRGCVQFLTDFTIHAITKCGHFNFAGWSTSTLCRDTAITYNLPYVKYNLSLLLPGQRSLLYLRFSSVHFANK